LLSRNEIIPINHPNITLHIKREDLLHPTIPGNKWRKLKYNLIQAKANGQRKLLTFGGAFSNHIAAVAAAGKEFGFETIGIIRGDELSTEIAANPTLSFAGNSGMSLHFVSRESYQNKGSEEFVKHLENQYGDFYLIPEGGTNAHAIKGCEEILTGDDFVFDYICCAVGTGGTISGLINSARENQHVLGFSALKGDFLEDDIRTITSKSNWKLITDYHFGGYGKINAELIGFINDFYRKTKIPLDPVYTSKMLFGVMDLINKGYFREGSKILVIHTGGLQGVEGMNIRLTNKKLPLIEFND
jgi:1-aminocyclopropane-1-carboxylate deaminase